MLLAIKDLLFVSFKNVAIIKKMDCQRWWCWSLQHSRLLHQNFNDKVMNMVGKSQIPANEKISRDQDPEVCSIFRVYSN